MKGGPADSGDSGATREGRPAPASGRRPPRTRPTHWDHPVDEGRLRARAQRHRFRKVLLLLLALAVAALAGAYWYATRPDRVRAFAERYLGQRLNTKVEIGRARFSLLSRSVTLEDLQVHAPPPYTEPILAAERVDLELDLAKLLRLKTSVREIVVLRPRVTLVLWDEKRWNFQALAEKVSQSEPLAMRPRLALDEGRLVIRRKVGGQPVYEQEMHVSGLLLPVEANPHEIRFQTVVSSEEVSLSVTSGVFDTETGALRLEGQASNVTLTPELYASLPSEVQLVWDRFEPEGSVNLKIAFDERQGLRLGTDLTGVRFAYGYQGRQHRFENLTGRAIFTPAGLRLESVRGLLDGSPMTLDGSISGFDGEALAADLEVTVESVSLREHEETLSGLAAPFESLYRDYEPEGTVDVTIRAQRGPDPEADVQAEGAILCRGVTISYRGFPYRIEKLRGKVEFGPNGFRLDGVRGFHGTSPITLSSELTNPGDAFGLDTTIRGEDIPIDQDLRAALPEESREAYDAYHAAGKLNLLVRVTREPRLDAKITTTIDAELVDCTIKHENFPYELREASGEVHLGAGRAVIHRVVGRHGDARVEVTGEILPEPADDRPIRLDIKGTGVAIDEDLEAALPPNERETFRMLHLSGVADVEGTVTSGPEIDLPFDYDLVVRPRGARMVYEPFPFLAEDVTGEVHLTPRRTRIESLAGANRDARLRAVGWIEHRPDDYAMDLTIRGENVPLSAQLRGAFMPEVRSAWSAIGPRGRVDVSARISKAFGEKRDEVEHHVWVTPRDAAVRIRFFPYPLEAIEGRIEFVEDEVRLHDVKAREGPTEFRLDGRIAFEEEGQSIRLDLEAKGLRLEGPIRRALPKELAKTFKRLRPTGRMDVRLTELNIQVPDKGPTRAGWKGTALLDEVSLSPGIEIGGAVGTASASGRLADGRLALDAELRLQQGTIAGLAVSNLTLGLAKDAASERLRLPTIEGEFYGGRLEGAGTLGTGADGGFAIDLAIQGAAFDAFLRDGMDIEDPPEGGRLDATFAADEAAGRRSGLRASGHARVTDASLYELPPLVRVLNLLRLKPPDRTAFRTAEIIYFVIGKKVFLEDIRLEGRSMNLYGIGTVGPEGRLNLTFRTGKKGDQPLSTLLTELVEGVRRELVVIEVTGTLSKPEVQTRPLSRLSAPLRELQQLIRESRGRGGS